MKIELLEKALAREKKARQEAENILEKKTLELYDANMQLQELNTSTNLFPEENPNPVMRYSGLKYDLIYANKHGLEINLFLNNSSSRKAKELFTQELSFSFENKTPNQFDMAIENKTMRFFIVPFPLKNYINIYASDITDIKEAEVRMQNITAKLIQAQQLAKIGSWELDITSNHMFFSKELFDVLQVDQKKFIPSHDNYINLLHPDDKQLTNDLFNNAIKEKKDYVMIQRRILDNGESIYLECRGQIDLGKDGEVRRLHGILIDISDKVIAQQAKEDFTKKLEIKVKVRTKELVESLEREKELSVLKTNFVSMVSHEFRTPLATINANSEIILRYFDKLSRDDINKRLGKIKSEVFDMTVMLEDILIIGKSDAQKLDFNPVYLDIVSLIKDIIAEYQLSEPKSRTIIYNVSTPIIMIPADKKWIKHIVNNLLSNAIKYSGEDQQIEISIKKEPTGISFSFKDYGVGIAKEDIAMLFEPFYRGENVGEISGTGLGLVILQKALNLHKGKIEVDSEIGKGSNFRVTLPAVLI